MDTPIVSGPYAHAAASISRTMLLVMLALLPATLFGVYAYGWPALNLRERPARGPCLGVLLR